MCIRDSYQYLRSDNDEDNAAPQFGAQLAGDAASAPDAWHPVTRAVGNVKNQGPELLAPLIP